MFETLDFCDIIPLLLYSEDRMETNEIISLLVAKLPPYALSHIYDISVYEIGILASVITSFVKDPIKKAIKTKAYNGGNDDKYIKRWNLIIVLIAAGISEIMFFVFSMYSSHVSFFNSWMVVAFFVPTAVYTVIEMLDSSWLSRMAVIFVIAVTLYGNKLYCLYNENHHKVCYAFKIMVFIFAFVGILLQIFSKKVKEMEE